MPIPFHHPNVSTLIVGKSPTAKQESAEFLSRSGKRLFELNQQHTTECLVLSANTSLNSSELKQPADAVLSDRDDVVLSVYTADCVPVLLTHRPNGTNAAVIGAVHAGRKGTEGKILQKTLAQLVNHWGTGQTTLWFGPHICARCYEINQEPSIKYNLQAKLTEQVRAVLPDNSYQIIYSEQCTLEKADKWYSYRKEGKGVPMNYSYIALSR